jgi:hypothetical protein
MLDVDGNKIGELEAIYSTPTPIGHPSALSRGACLGLDGGVG